MDIPSKAGDVAVAFSDVRKSYGRVPALRQIGFKVHRGEVVALLGPNGAGKTTTIDILLGLRRPDGGDVRVLGSAPLRAIVAGRVGAMLQTTGLPDGAKAGEVLDLACALYGRIRTTSELAELAGLTELTSRRVDKLSGGEAQRLLFALALAGNPELLLLDEPTVSLDVTARGEFWRRVRELADGGITVVFATHYLEEADQNASRVVMLHNGAVVADGPPSAITSQVAVRTVRCVLTDPDSDWLRALPGVTQVGVHGQEVVLRCADADAVTAALFAAGLDVRNLRVTGADLADALGALTGD